MSKAYFQSNRPSGKLVHLGYITINSMSRGNFESLGYTGFYSNTEDELHTGLWDDWAPMGKKSFNEFKNLKPVESDVFDLLGISNIGKGRVLSGYVVIDTEDAKLERRFDKYVFLPAEVFARIV